jgi:hypothetical protein
VPFVLNLVLVREFWIHATNADSLVVVCGAAFHRPSTRIFLEAGFEPSERGQGQYVHRVITSIVVEGAVEKSVTL